MTADTTGALMKSSPRNSRLASPGHYVLVLAALAGSANAQSPEAVFRGRALPENTPDFCYEVNRSWVDANPIPSGFQYDLVKLQGSEERNRPFTLAQLEQVSGVWSCPERAPPRFGG